MRKLGVDPLRDFGFSLDPMLDFVKTYIAALDHLSSAPRDDDYVDAFCAEKIDPMDEALLAGAVFTTTSQGAVAALMLAERQCKDGSPELAMPLMAAVRGFLQGRAA